MVKKRRRKTYYTIQYYDTFLRRWRTSGLYKYPPKRLAKSFQKEFKGDVKFVKVIKTTRPSWMR